MNFFIACIRMQKGSVRFVLKCLQHYLMAVSGCFIEYRTCSRLLYVAAKMVAKVVAKVVARVFARVVVRVVGKFLHV